MNDASPATGRGSSRLPGGRRSQGNEPDRTFDRLRWETRSRCLAVLQELDVDPPDWDVIATLLEGAAEEIQAAL